jgi:hypothetical protein
MLLPFFHVMQQSQRAAEHLSRELPGGADWLDPGSWFVARKGHLLRGVLNGWVFGEPYAGVEPPGGAVWPLALSSYAGVAAAVGAVASVANRRPRRRSAPLLAFGTIVLFLAVGFLPFLHLLWPVPVLRLPEYSRFEPAAILALCLAGALGLDHLLCSPLSRRRLAVTVLVSVVSLWLAVKVSVAAASGFLVLSMLAAARSRRFAFALALLAVGVDLVPWGRRLLPRADPAHFFPSSAILEALKREAGGGRAVGLDKLVYPSLLPVYGIPEVRPHNPLTPASQREVLAAAFSYQPTTREYFSSFRHADHPLLRFLGVQTVLSNVFVETPQTLEPVNPELSEVYRQYRVPDALARWFLPEGADVVPRAQIGRWIVGMDSPRRVALVSEEVGSWRPLERSFDPSLVVALEARPGQARLRIAGEGERLLATSLPGPFGWRAAAGRHRLRTLSVNGAFLGVVLPPGIQHVELQYVPPGLPAGVAVFALAATAIGGLLIKTLRRRKVKGSGAV